MTRLLMLEFNELAPGLMDEFIDEGILPNFARMRREGWAGLTDPEEPQETLEPWIQWVTVHTGLPLADHRLRNLGEDHRLEVPTVGEIVGAAGLPTVVFGSMNVPHRVEGAVHLPDPWTVEGQARPAELQRVFAVLRTMIQEKDSGGHRPGSTDLASASSVLLRRGVRPATVRAALRQLADERRDERGRWGRALILDAITWDLFRWYERKTEPAFATYFSNSTAHFQHHHWRDHAPELFEGGPNREPGAGDAVRSGYVAMDRTIGQALDLVGPSGTLVFCTGLSQQPYLQYDDSGGKTLHHPISRDALMGALGVEGFTRITPVMSEVFHVRFDDAGLADAAETRLRAATLEGVDIFGVTRDAEGLRVSCVRHTPVDAGAVIRVEPDLAVPFDEHFVAASTAKSGFHHPTGMLWIHGPGIAPATDEAPVSLRAVAPTLLSLLGLDPAPTMTTAPIEVGAPS